MRNDSAFLNNKIFELDELYGMKSDNYPFKALKTAFTKLGIDFQTYDCIEPEKADAIICLDEVKTYKKLNLINKKSYLIISEPPVYTPENWDTANHSYFEKVFTYDASLCKSEKYVHYTFAIDFDSYPGLMDVKENHFLNRSLCSIIAGSFQISKPKKNTHSLLYERYKIIKWFTKHHPSDLHFFSRNINKQIFEFFSGASVLNKLNLNFIVKAIATKNFNTFITTYKGAIPALDKITKQQEFNFSICFENSTGIHGCVSEKIFDCFAASSVPVYLGAPNITNLIPKNCFIDKRDYKNYHDLYNYIKRMPYGEYVNYLNNIREFLYSDKINTFKVETYVNKIISNIKI